MFIDIGYHITEKKKMKKNNHRKPSHYCCVYATFYAYFYTSACPYFYFPCYLSYFFLQITRQSFPIPQTSTPSPEK